MRLLIALTVAGLLLCSIALQAKGAPRKLTLAGLRADFNAASSKVRVLAIMSPG